MLTKDLLRVSRRGGGYQPAFASHEHHPLATEVLGAFQNHVGEPRAHLDESLTKLEADAEHFKLVRGFTKLLEREATFETEAPLPPERTRRRAFEAAEAVGVVSEDEREEAIGRVANQLSVPTQSVETSLYADLTERQILTSFDARWEPEELVAQYNLSLAQTALFDAVEVRVRSNDPKTLVSTVKWLGLLYEIEQTDDGREVVVTGPDGLFRRTRRYGTRFARLLRTVAKTDEWHLVGTIDDRGTERTIRLSSDDPIVVPDTEPVAEVRYDSGVEADFATRFSALDLDWELVREPEPLAAGATVMIPDFAFDWRHADFRVYFEIVGFWTPEYVDSKLEKLATVEAVELLVAVDDSLGVGEEIEAQDHRVIPYSGTVRVKDVRDALRRYEKRLVEESADGLPDELEPADDVLTLAELAAIHGTSEAAIEGKQFPAHERVGRTLVRPNVLESLRTEIEDGMDFAAAEDALAARGIDDVSALLSVLGYRVEWDGLSGGTVRNRE